MISHEGEVAANPGQRIEYLVTERRGALALYEPVVNPRRASKTVAAGLAQNLGIGVADLVGCHFSCWVAPAEYGVFQSDFRLVAHGKGR